MLIFRGVAFNGTSGLSEITTFLGGKLPPFYLARVVRGDLARRSGQRNGRLFWDGGYPLWSLTWFTWKSAPGTGDSFWKAPCSGSMLNFGGKVFDVLKLMFLDSESWDEELKKSQFSSRCWFWSLALRWSSEPVVSHGAMCDASMSFVHELCRGAGVFKKEVCPCYRPVSGIQIIPRWITNQAPSLMVKKNHLNLGIPRYLQAVLVGCSSYVFYDWFSGCRSLWCNRCVHLVTPLNVPKLLRFDWCQSLCWFILIPRHRVQVK